MADAYIDSTAGGANTGVDWTDAFNLGTQADWTSAFTRASAAGDRIFVANDNATVTTADTTLTANTNHTIDNPLRIIVATPPGTTPVSDYGTSGNGEIEGTTGLDHIIFANNIYIRGLRILIGDGINTGFDPGRGNRITLDRCFLGISVSSQEGWGIAEGLTTFRDCDVIFSGTGKHYFLVSTDGSCLRMIGGTFDHQVTAPSYFFRTNVAPCIIECIGVDFSSSNNPTSIIEVNNPMELNYFRFIGCKFPASYTLIDTTSQGELAPHIGDLLELPLNNPYSFERYFKEGNVIPSTTIYRNNGANDGTNDFSLKVDVDGTSNNGFGYVMIPLGIVNSGNLSTKTVKVHFAQNSGAALTDNDIWVDVITNGALDTNARATPGTGGTTHNDESGTEDWRDGAGALTGYNEQSMSVSGFGTTAGLTAVYLCLSDDFSTSNLYVCPKIEIA